jgi:hypothetical protein
MTVVIADPVTPVTSSGPLFNSFVPNPLLDILFSRLLPLKAAY